MKCQIFFSDKKNSTICWLLNMTLACKVLKVQLRYIDTSERYCHNFYLPSISKMVAFLNLYNSLGSWVKVPEILNSENPLFQYWKLPFPFTLHRTKKLLNTEFSTCINTENFHPCGLIQQTTNWWVFFNFFPRKQDSTFHANCLLFSGKNKKYISVCRLLKILPGVLSVKGSNFLPKWTNSFL